ncbi:hypothetical protein Bpfe_010952, partial [Biomphalaria pfeifferi]
AFYSARVGALQMTLTVSLENKDEHVNANVSCCWDPIDDEVPIRVGFFKDNQLLKECALESYDVRFCSESDPLKRISIYSQQTTMWMHIREIEESDMAEYACVVELIDETIWIKTLILSEDLI